MKHEIPYDDICTAAWDADIDEDDIRFDYEGRGMYGQGGCLGIVHGGLTEVINFAIFLSEQGYGEAIRSNSLQDGMGTNTITYWPDVKVADAPGDRDEW